MSKIKRDTNKDLMEGIYKLVCENGHYDKAEKIMDYFLSDSLHNRELSNYEFDFFAVPSFGGNEGIYLDCYIKGNFDENDSEVKTLNCGTFKTLNTDVESMKVMGELGGALTYYASLYVNQNIDRYTPERELNKEDVEK